MLTAAARYVAYRKAQRALKRRALINSLSLVLSAATVETQVEASSDRHSSEPNVQLDTARVPNVERELIHSRLEQSISSSYAATKAMLEACSRQEHQVLCDALVSKSESEDVVITDEEYADENLMEFRLFDNASQADRVTHLLAVHDPLKVKHARVLDTFGISLWQCGAMVGVLLANLHDQAVQVNYAFVHPSMRGNRLAELMMHRLIVAHSFKHIRVIEPRGFDAMLPALRRACQRLAFAPSVPSTQWLSTPMK